MYHSNLIISRIESDRALALKLDHAFAGVMKGVEQQLSTIGAGISRLSYYASCLTDNYKDVCTTMAEEDIRFLYGIAQLIKKRKIVSDMIKIYINELLKKRRPESIASIQRNLLNLNVHISRGQLTKVGLIYSTTNAICYSLSLNASIDMAITKMIAKASSGAVTVFGLYGIVQQASESANRLKRLAPQYYKALYVHDIEMMYFLIEPVIEKSRYIKETNATNSDIADAISRMMR